MNESYINDIKNATGITVWAKSKWLNAVYVQGTQSNIEALENLSFVTGIEWMDKDLNFPQPSPTPNKFAVEENRIIYDYGIAANQIEMIKGDFLHQQDFTGDGIIIAVMDSGFHFSTNPAFSHIVNNNKLLGTYDFSAGLQMLQVRGPME